MWKAQCKHSHIHFAQKHILNSCGSHRDRQWQSENNRTIVSIEHTKTLITSHAVCTIVHWNKKWIKSTQRICLESDWIPSNEQSQVNFWVSIRFLYVFLAIVTFFSPSLFVYYYSCTVAQVDNVNCKSRFPFCTNTSVQFVHALQTKNESLPNWWVDSTVNKMFLTVYENLRRRFHMKFLLFNPIFIFFLFLVFGICEKIYSLLKRYKNVNRPTYFIKMVLARNVIVFSSIFFQNRNWQLWSIRSVWPNCGNGLFSEQKVLWFMWIQKYKYFSEQTDCDAFAHSSVY